MSELLDTPNVSDAATVQNSAPTMDSIAQKMAAMRNQVSATVQAETGSEAEATATAPVDPEGNENDTSSVEPEVDNTESQDRDAAADDSEAPEEVSSQDSTKQEVIDFIEFANENPDAKFKFMRNGKEMVIDAKRAAAILGQGGAIHEEARELKVQKAEFDEYLKTKQSEAEGLTLALEFTVRPQIQKAYDEILKTQQYQQTFAQQLQVAEQRGDYASITKIQANMAQNDRWIQQQNATIQQLKPNLDQFYQIRKQQVASVLETNRQQFKDKELRNEYVYNELREKVAKNWAGAKGQLVPGIDNLDLISADEHIMSLIKDGFKYREKPSTKSAGSSIAALTSKKTPFNSGKSQGQVNFQQLQERANKGDRKAQDNLLVAKMNALRGRK